MASYIIDLVFKPNKIANYITDIIRRYKADL
jgi:hypothetical protein